jgi:hypothetical protein
MKTGPGNARVNTFIPLAHLSTKVRLALLQ